MPGPAGRVAYTDTDDDNLVKFLAEYNADGTGRLGNVLWKLLGNDDTSESLPWARRHPWQSWRDRYNKNAPYFDSRVKKYLKKHPTSKTIKKDVKEAKVEGSRSTESGGKRKRARDSDDVRKDEKRSKVTRDEAQDKGEGSSRRGGEKAKMTEKPDRRVRKAREEEEDVLQKIGSDDYTAEIFDEADTDDEDEPDVEDAEGGSSGSVGEIVDSVEPETNSEAGSPGFNDNRSETTTASKPRLSILDDARSSKIYPDIATIPTPYLHSTTEGEVSQYVPGAFNEPNKTLPRSDASRSTIARPKRVGKASQEHTPPISHPSSNTDATSPVPGPSTTLHPIIVSSSPSVPSTALSQAPTTQALKSKPKARQRLPSPAYSDSEDIFKSAPPSSRNSPFPEDHNRNKNSARTVPPKHVEGPFLNSIGSQRGIWRDNQDDDSDDGSTAQWPPARGRHRTPLPTQSQKITTDKGKGKARAVEDDTSQERIVAHATTQAPAASRTDKMTAGSMKQPEDETKIHSSTEVPVAFKAADNMEQSSTKRSSTSTATIGSASASHSHRATVDDNERLDFLPTARASSSKLTGPSTARVTALRQESASAFIPRVPSSFISPNDPFIDASTSASGHRGKGKNKDNGIPVSSGMHRRHTFGGELPQFAPRLDLRTVGWGMRSGRSMPSHLHSHAGTAPPSRRTSNSSRASISPSISIPATDLEILCDMSLRQAIELISRNHGYQEEVTWNFWRQTKSLQITDEILRRLKEINETEGAKLIEEKMQELENNADGSEADLDEVNVGPVPVKLRGLSESPVLSPPRRRSKKYSLQFTPGPIDDERDSEYYPPETSRAAQFRRPSNHEIVEALKQESRRTSGGTLPSPFRLPRPSELEISQIAREEVDTTLKKEDSEAQVVESELLMDVDLEMHAMPDREPHTAPEEDHIDPSPEPLYIWNDIEDDRILLSAEANNPELIKLQERAGDDLIEEHVVRLFC